MKGLFRQGATLCLHPLLDLQGRSAPLMWTDRNTHNSFTGLCLLVALSVRLPLLPFLPAHLSWPKEALHHQWRNFYNVYQSLCSTCSFKEHVYMVILIYQAANNCCFFISLYVVCPLSKLFDILISSASALVILAHAVDLRLPCQTSFKIDLHAAAGRKSPHQTRTLALSLVTFRLETQPQGANRLTECSI